MTDNKEALGTSQDAQATSEPFPAPPTPEQIAEWEELYLNVDVKQAMRNMQAWCKANPARRKTKKGILRFVTNWLASDQNSGRNKRRQSAAHTYDSADDFCALMEDDDGC